MNIDTLSIIAFYSVLFFLFIKYKSKFTMQGIIALYKTSIGLNLMERLAKVNRKLVLAFATAGIVIGFLGMAAGFILLLKETLKFLIVPETAAPLVPLLPGISIPGVPTLSFLHWIIALFISAAIHEFSHGVIARFYKIPIKSSGFAFLGPILAAFVEPDDKVMEQKRPMKQLGVYAAGPFSNILLGLLFFLIFNLITAPLFIGSIAENGITVSTLIEGSPAYEENITVPFTLLKINGQETLSALQFVNATNEITPGSIVELETDKGTFQVISAENPDNESQGFIGLSGFKQEITPAGRAKGQPWLLGLISWINLMAMWLFVINVGIAIFNLLPFIPADGGRMALVALQSIYPAGGKKVWLILQVATVSLIIINLLPWVFKLLAWIFKIFVLVASFSFS